MGKKLTIVILGILAAAMALSFQTWVGQSSPNPYHSSSENILRASFKKLTINEVKSRLAANPNIKLIDVRSKEEFAVDHLQGAISIPLEEVESKAPAAVQRDDEIIFYCHDGPMGETAANTLASLGYSNLANMEGGINKWRFQGYPVVK